MHIKCRYRRYRFLGSRHVYHSWAACEFRARVRLLCSSYSIQCSWLQYLDVCNARIKALTRDWPADRFMGGKCGQGLVKVTSVAFINITISKGVSRCKRQQTPPHECKKTCVDWNQREVRPSFSRSVRVGIQNWEETDPHSSNVLPLLYTFHCYLRSQSTRLDLCSVHFLEKDIVFLQWWKTCHARIVGTC